MPASAARHTSKPPCAPAAAAIRSTITCSLPTRYDDLHAEYEKLLTGVTVWDVSVERQVEITGPDAFAFTNPAHA